MTAILQAENVTCMAGGREVVKDVSLEIRGGEIVALLGPSGSGKTVLLTVLGGLSRPSSGRVLVEGRPLAEEPGLRTRIAFVFQTYGLLSLLTAFENVEVALRAAGFEPPHARSITTDALAAMDVESFSDHLIEELSGGQVQRVAVARALALAPQALLVDEPTTEQDPEHRDLVLRHLLGAATGGAGVLVATHDEKVAARCDRVVELHDGLLVDDHRESLQ